MKTAAERFAEKVGTADANGCMPYLRVKKEQAELGIEFQEGKRTITNLIRSNGYKKKGFAARLLSDEELLKRDEYRKRMRILNK